MTSRIIRNVISLLLLILLSPALVRAQGEGAQPRTAPPAQQVAGVVIDLHDYPGPPGQLPSLARELITLKPGQAFSQDYLNGSVSLLKLSGRFEDVSAETREGAEGLEVVFHLKPYLLIRDIRVSGLYPLFEEDILTAMTVFVGSPLQPDTASSQEGLLTQFLRSEGFIDPKVKVSTVDAREDGTVILDVILDKGSYYRLKTLDITGNRQFSDTRLRPRMNIWIRSFFRGSSGRFIEKSLTQDVKDLTSFYWSKGYADAEVSSSLNKDTHTGNIGVTVKVKEGPLYKVSYTGNRSFYPFTLNKQLVLFKDGNRGGSGVRKSARNLHELYLSSGFPDAKVKPTVETATKEGREVRKVRFDIEEGSRAVVDSVDFTGNTAFDKDFLQGKIGTGKKTNPILGKRLFSRDVLEQDIQTITTLYVDQGYASVAVGADLRWSADKKGVAVVFPIAEGVRTLVSSVSIEGVTCLSPRRARECVQLAENAPFNRTIMKKDEVSLATCISEQGYPRVQVQSSAATSKDGKEAYVKYTVTQGRLVTMGNTYFGGNFMTRRRLLNRELDMDQGDPFSLSKMVKGQNAIRDMNVFNTVKFKTLGLRENQDQVTVVADLEEKKPYYVQTSLGYESYAGEYVNARIGDHNLFGLNRDVWLGAGISQVSQRYELGVNAPRLLGTRVTGVYNLYWEKREDFNQNFGLRTLGYNLGLIKKFGRRVFTVVNLSYEKRNEFIIDEAQQAQLDEGKSPEDLADEAETLKPRSIVVVSPGITYDTRDSFLHPKNGNFSYGAFDLSQGLKNSQDVDNFIRYRADVREYTTPFDRLTFAWMGKVGYIMPTNNTDVLPDDQLFYLGGSLNVRGYKENMLLYDENNNPVGGRFSLASSVEARLALIDGIELALFFDAGTIRDTNAHSVVPDTRASYGTGLRYITPIGPISLVYGHKLRPEPGESPYEWHFSLGYTF